MMKKIVLGILFVFAVSFIIAGLLISSNRRKENKKESEYVKKYDVNLVDSTGFKLRNFYYNDGYEVALFFISDKNYRLVNIEATFYDKENNVVDTTTTPMNYINSNKEFVLSTVVSADTVKRIDVKVVPENTQIPIEGFIFLDRSQIKFTNEVTKLEDNKIKISLKANNPFDKNINFMSGYILLYDGDTLVDMIYFDSINIPQGGEIFKEVETLLYDSTGQFKYTDVKVLINELI